VNKKQSVQEREPGLGPLPVTRKKKEKLRRPPTTPRGEVKKAKKRLLKEEEGEATLATSGTEMKKVPR